MKRNGRATAIAFAALLTAFALVSCRDGKKAAEEPPTELPAEETKALDTSDSAENVQTGAALMAEEDASTAYALQGWSAEDMRTLEGVCERIDYGYNVTRANPQWSHALFDFVYTEADGSETLVPSPVGVYISQSEEGVLPFKQNRSLIKASGICGVAISSANDFSAMAFLDRDKGSYILTALFSTDRWQSWNSYDIGLDKNYWGDDLGGRPSFSIYCTSPTTGYLKLWAGTDSGGTLYRTEDSGASWENVCALPPNKEGFRNGILYAHDGKVFLKRDGDTDGFFFLYKTEDFANWTELRIPLEETKKFKDSPYLSRLQFEGEYGVARAAISTRKIIDNKAEWDKTYLFYATKDGGENWVFWKEVDGNS